jgi:hypothetical protein
MAVVIRVKHQPSTQTVMLMYVRRLCGAQSAPIAFCNKRLQSLVNVMTWQRSHDHHEKIRGLGVLRMGLARLNLSFFRQTCQVVLMSQSQ